MLMLASPDFLLGHKLVLLCDDIVRIMLLLSLLLITNATNETGDIYMLYMLRYSIMH